MFIHGVYIRDFSLQTEIAGEVEVGNDEDNEAVAKDGNDDNGGNKTKTKSKRRRKQPEPKKKRKGPQV